MNNEKTKDVWRRFFQEGDAMHGFDFRFVAPDSERVWSFYGEGSPSPPSLQIVEYAVSDKAREEEGDKWLYLSPYEARCIGAVFLAFAEAHDGASELEIAQARHTRAMRRFLREQFAGADLEDNNE